MPHGSPFWQGIIFLGAMLFLVWEAWRGWRAGLIRSGLNLAAMVVSGVVLYYGAQVASAPFGGLGSFPGFMAGLVVGGGLAFVAFALIWLVGALAFKRTEHQGSGLVRLFWGMGGALFGVILGVFLLWGGISILRTLGVLAESRLTSFGPTPAPPVASGAHSAGTRPTKPSFTQNTASNLVVLKKSLELGPAGQFVESVDVIPPDFYELVLQIGQVTGSQEAMQRFIQYPGIQQLMNNGRMADLLNDPAVMKAAEEKNYMALVGNKALRDAVEDPGLAEALKKIDLRAALKFALETPPSSPSPSPQR